MEEQADGDRKGRGEVVHRRSDAQRRLFQGGDFGMGSVRM